MTIQKVDDGNSDGVQFNNTKVGFFGATPVARPSVTWPNTATATTALNEAKANRIMAALVSLGLIVTT
ncbi:MAG TPA: hypothetical protein VIK33_10600 [Anaerolineae bacterium]